MKTPLSSASENALKGPILITGSQGMLGSDLCKVFRSYLGQDPVIGLGHKDLDITNAQEVKNTLNEISPSLVINAAAYTNVDKAETERELAYNVNFIGVENLAEACNDIDSFLVHFSTDQVFEGKEPNQWTEACPTAPTNHYAYTKFLGENAALDYAHSLVLRVQWLYGVKKDRFTYLKDKKEFTPILDQYGAPTWTLHIAETLLELLKKKATGLYHLCHDDSASWSEIYEFVRDTMGYETTLIPVKTDSLNLPARRPTHATLSNQKLLNTLGRTHFGSWKSALKMFLMQHGMR